MNNTRILHLCVLALLWLSLAPVAIAQQEATSEANSAAQRPFDAKSLQDYRDNPDFQYHRDKPEPPKRKPRERERLELPDTHAPTYRGPRGDFSGLAKGIFWVLMIGLAVFIIMQLFKVDWGSIFKKKSDKAKVVAETEIPVEEDVTKMEFEDLVQTAVNAGRFREAVRLLYLRSLRQLNDQGLIGWKKEKTNHDYLRELKDPEIRTAFSDVTLIFEYIWYGEFPVNKDEFNIARASFVQFEQTMRQRHAV